MNFNCPQHQCVDCQQKTSDAGGMIYRCRWCERGYCEDCLDWDRADLIGENLTEFELLGFPSVTQAYFIRCPCCKDQHIEDPVSRDFCERHIAQYDSEYQEKLNQQLAAVAADAAKKTKCSPSRAESLTDATTLDDSGVSTPQLGISDNITSSSSKKRKDAPQSLRTTPSKRSTRIVA